VELSTYLIFYHKEVNIMSDKLVTLHLESDDSVNVYPNIKTENIPDDGVTPRKLSKHIFRHDATITYAPTSLTLRVATILNTDHIYTDIREFIGVLYDVYGVNSYHTANGSIGSTGIIQYFVIVTNDTIDICYLDTRSMTLQHAIVNVNPEFTMNDIVVTLY
jgi:hypothetical protein